MNKYNIGDVWAIRGEPPDGNPYRADGHDSHGGLKVTDQALNGPERAEVLRLFMRGKPTHGITFWYAPACGGAKKCTRDEVNWESSGLSIGEWGPDDKYGDMVRCKTCGTKVWVGDRRRCKCDEEKV